MTIKIKRFEAVQFSVDSSTKKLLEKVAEINHQKLSELVRQIFYRGLKTTNIHTLGEQLFILDNDAKGKSKSLVLKEKYEN